MEAATRTRPTAAVSHLVVDDPRDALALEPKAAHGPGRVA
jgi:hypothetical protein